MPYREATSEVILSKLVDGERSSIMRARRSGTLGGVAAVQFLIRVTAPNVAICALSGRSSRPLAAFGEYRNLDLFFRHARAKHFMVLPINTME